MKYLTVLFLILFLSCNEVNKKFSSTENIFEDTSDCIDEGSYDLIPWFTLKKNGETFLIERGDKEEEIDFDSIRIKVDKCKKDYSGTRRYFTFNLYRDGIIVKNLSGLVSALSGGSEKTNWNFDNIYFYTAHYSLGGVRFRMTAWENPHGTKEIEKYIKQFE